jgi:biotin carboxyl carrier protein
VRTGDLHVHLSVSGAAAPTSDGGAATDVLAVARSAGIDGEVDGEVDDVPAASDRDQTFDHSTTAADRAGGDVTKMVDGGTIVAAPTPGIFWRSPEPGAPPFADIGETVESSETVCIVEVMKLMNHVKAGVRGRVVAVHGENGVAVGKGDALFTIVPDDSADPGAAVT